MAPRRVLKATTSLSRLSMTESIFCTSFSSGCVSLVYDHGRRLFVSNLISAEEP